MQRTAIEYLDYTCNPVAMRCTPVSAGCENCWHLRMAKRHAANPYLSSDLREARGGGAFSLIEKELSAPLRLRKPARIGCQLMGDLFHVDISYERVAAVFGVAAACPRHTFVMLTKRPALALSVISHLHPERCLVAAKDLGRLDVFDDLGETPAVWPLPNVWLGVSVEDQATADERVPILLTIPAAVRWVSYEPALGPVDFSAVLGEIYGPPVGAPVARPQAMSLLANQLQVVISPAVSWIVAGAETGPGKRPAKLDWFRSLRDQCAASGTPYFFKQDSQGNRELDGRLHEEMP